MKSIRNAVLLASFTWSALVSAESPKPPVIAKKVHAVTAPHGAVRNDDYYWLRDDTRKNPEMLAVLNAENAYADAMLASSKPTAGKLYAEITGRIKQDDSSVPFLRKGYWYYTRFETGKDYAIIARRKGSMDAPEEILFDQNVMAEGKGYFAIGDYEISPDNRLVAWAEDAVGRRQYTLRVKDLATGKVFADTVENIEANIIWADDNRTLFYIEKDPVTLLSKRVKTHVLGSAAKDDALVYEESDDSFYMGISRSRSDAYICIGVQSTVSSEMRCTSAAKPGKFTVFAPRQRDVEYSADHLDGRWVIRTNWNAPNYRLMTRDDTAADGDRKVWKELVPHAGDVFIEGFELFKDYIAIEERSNALLRLRTLAADGKSAFVASDEPAYTMGLNINAEPDTDWLRYAYTSLTTPNTVYEVNMRTGERRLLKRDPVLGGYTPEDYVTERLWATARDGTRIPVSLVYKKGFKKDGKAALLQYAYGSYGASTDPRFSIINVSLLDRGMVYAIAHIRGGQEMGRRSGTENVMAIAGFGAACAAAQQDLADGRWERVAQLRNILEKAIETSAEETIFVGKQFTRLPNTSCFIAKGWKGETQVMALDLAGFAISAGSACSSGKVKASPVLAALGYSYDEARCAVRVSLGIETTMDEVLRFAQAWTEKHARANARS